MTDSKLLKSKDSRRKTAFEDRTRVRDGVEYTAYSQIDVIDVYDDHGELVAATDGGQIPRDAHWQGGLFDKNGNKLIRSGFRILGVVEDDGDDS